MSKPVDQHEADDAGRPPSTADWVAAAGRDHLGHVADDAEKQEGGTEATE